MNIIKRKIACVFLVMVLIIPQLCVISNALTPSIQFESNQTFTINGRTISCKSVNTDEARKNCHRYAHDMYKIIWGGKNYYSRFDYPQNILNQLSSEERKISQNTVKYFIGLTELGASIRVCNSAIPLNSSNDIDGKPSGHTMILVNKSVDGFSTFESNYAGSKLVWRTYTWESFTNEWEGKYPYLNYIIWPNGTPISTGFEGKKTCTITFDPNGGSVSPTSKTLTAGTLLTGMPTPTRSGYTFVGWTLDRIDPDSSDVQVSTIVSDGVFTFDKDTTLYAQWRRNCTNHSYDADICTNCGAKLPYDNKFDASAAGTYRVSENTAYIRTGPYQVKDLIRTVNRGEILQAVGSVINSYNNTWLKTTDGYYVHADKLTRINGTQLPIHEPEILSDRQLFPDGVYTLAPLCALGSRLDVAGADWRDNANVQIHESNGTLAQQWELTYLGEGYYKLICKASGKALDVSQAGTEPGTNVQQFTPNGTIAQQWKIDTAADGSYFLIPRVNEGLCLDVSGAGNVNGTNVQVYTANGTAAQMWDFTLVDSSSTSNSGSSVSAPQYFNCNVGVFCEKGKTVNLYNNPGDSSRVDYFSLGQSVGSTYGVNMPDGSTWYQVSVTSKGNVITVWLKYESDKMIVRNLG